MWQHFEATVSPLSVCETKLEDATIALNVIVLFILALVLIVCLRGCWDKMKLKKAIARGDSLQNQLTQVEAQLQAQMHLNQELQRRPQQYLQQQTPQSQQQPIQMEVLTNQSIGQPTQTKWRLIDFCIYNRTIENGNDCQLLMLEAVKFTNHSLLSRSNDEIVYFTPNYREAINNGNIRPDPSIQIDTNLGVKQYIVAESQIVPTIGERVRRLLSRSPHLLRHQPPSAPPVYKIPPNIDGFSNRSARAVRRDVEDQVVPPSYGEAVGNDERDVLINEFLDPVDEVRELHQQALERIAREQQAQQPAQYVAPAVQPAFVQVEDVMIEPHGEVDIVDEQLHAAVVLQNDAYLHVGEDEIHDDSMELEMVDNGVAEVEPVMA